MELERSTLCENMHQIVFEVLRTSLEEVEAGYCTEIRIKLVICRELEHMSGTEMILKPDKQIFGDAEFSLDVIRSWWGRI